MPLDAGTLLLMSGRPHFLQPVLKSAAGYALYVDHRDEPVATQLETAFDSASRNRGLLGRDGLPPGTALIIAPSNAVHTFSMRFAIDLIFAARDGVVVKVREALPRSRVSFAFRAFAVIELGAGALSGSGVRSGDRLVVKKL